MKRAIKSIDGVFCHIYDFHYKEYHQNFVTLYAMEMLLSFYDMNYLRVLGNASRKTVLCLAVFVCASYQLFSQEISRAQTATNGFYNWETNANWTDNSAAPTTNIGNPLQNAGGNPQIIIEGYITRNGALTFANIGNNTREFIVRDTLVVYGNVNFPGNSYNLILESGSVLVVFGDFTAGNKVTVNNGGLMVVDGNFTLSGGQNDYIDNNGSTEPNLIVTGSISGNGDTAAASADNGTLTQQTPAIQNFVNGNGETPLPIVLSKFRAAFNNGSVNLEWETLSEENFDYFEIQHSLDGKTFDVVGKVKGSGWSTELVRYDFVHAPQKFGRNYYRLRAIDFDGTYEIFHSLSVEVVPEFQSIRMFPNPSNGLQVQFELPVDFLQIEQLSISVIDLQGQVIEHHEVLDLQFKIEFEQKLPSGVYLVAVNTGSAQYTTKLLVN